MDLNYDGNGMLAGYTQSDTYTDWAGAQFANVYSREITRDGDRILSEKVTSIDGSLLTNDVKTVKYTYDAGGISGMIVGTTEYFFRRNIFGDVTAIYDVNGVKKAEYNYDAWGTCYMPVNVDGIGSLNPFRYRGYYFVSQIGLYYLTTRFYDYTTGRFLNADVPSVCIDNGLTVPEGCNLYSYCLNNPVMFTDSKGNSPFWDSIGNWFKNHWKELAIGAAFVVAGVLTMGVAAAVSGATFAGVMATMGSAAVSSLAQVGVSMAISAGIGAVVGGITGGWEGALRGLGNGLASGFMWGGIFAGVAQMASGAMSITRSLAPNFNGKMIGSTKLWSPNAATNKNIGGTLIKFGKYNRFDVEAGRGLHMAWKIFGRKVNHIPLGIMLSGLLGGI